MSSRQEQRFSRRHALGAGIAVAATVGLSRVARADTPLSAVVTLNGVTYEYDESTGTDLGDFVSAIGGFTQGCVRATASGSPLTVYFRPDRTSNRVEVVFELCAVFNTAPANLGAYSVVISQGGQQLASINVPEHYYYSRWRWQSAPRPLVGDIDTMIAQGLLPPYDRSGAPAGTTTGQQATYPGAPSAAQPAATASPAVSPSPSHSPAPTPAPTPTPTPAPTPASTRATPTPTPTPAPTPTPTPATTFTLPTLPNLSALLGSFWFLSTADASERRGLLKRVALGTASMLLATKSLHAPAKAATTSSTSTAYQYTIMGLAGVTAYMPATGERPDIGMLTEFQAQYVCTEDQTALATLRAQAEAAGTVPWHMRDETTNAPINLNSYPNASCYYDSRVGNPWIPTTTNPVTIDISHEPALAYLPYMLTGDPYHLEDLQFMTNHAWLSSPPAYRPAIGQSRAFAWYIRNLMQCARVTPATVPSWLLPQSYWIGFLNTNRTFLEQSYVNNPSPVTAMFRSTSDINSNPDQGPTAPGGCWIDPWQEEFVASVIGWAITMGFTEWQTSFDWKIGSTIARTSTTSGWVRSYATPYRVILRPTATSPLVTTWSEAWTLTDSVYLQGLNVTDDNDWPAGTDMTYLTYSRGALVYASRVGSTPLADNLTWATAQLNAQSWPTYFKWRIGTGLNG